MLQSVRITPLCGAIIVAMERSLYRQTSYIRVGLRKDIKVKTQISPEVSFFRTYFRAIFQDIL
jgi:hypothetical protein